MSGCDQSSTEEAAIRGYHYRYLGPGQWLRAWRHEDPSRSPHFILPHQEVSLVACLSATDGRVRVFGPARAAYTFRPASDQRMLGLVIAPEFAAQVIGVAAEELTDTSAEVPARLESRLSPLLDTLAGMPIDEAMVCWARALHRELGGPTVARRPEQYAAGLIRSSGGRIRIHRLAAELSISDRQFRRRFQQHLGLSPKCYSRLIRLTRAIESSDRHCDPDWVGLAAEWNYSDQAHLIRECRALTGLSPVRLHRQRHAMSETFNTAIPG